MPIRKTKDAEYNQCPHPQRAKRAHCRECRSAHSRARFYVSVVDGTRYGLLLGPYSDHAGALANVQRGKHLAEAANDRAFWYAYGTCSLKPGHPLYDQPGLLNEKGDSK